MNLHFHKILIFKDVDFKSSLDTLFPETMVNLQLETFDVMEFRNSQEYTFPSLIE